VGDGEAVVPGLGDAWMSGINTGDDPPPPPPHPMTNVTKASADAPLMIRRP
jgi:hypothetical protein